MPRLVEDFINRADSIESNYTYGVASAGGDPGFSLKKLKETLIRRGSNLHYGRKISVASNYMSGWYYKMISPDEETLEKNVIKTEQKCNIIAEDIRNKTTMIEKASYVNFILPQIISPNRYVKNTRPWDSEFTVSEECNGCKICASVCPVDNIIMEMEKPAFQGNCQRCMGCIQHCPKSAFQIEKKAMNKPKYIHPNIKVKEIIALNGSATS